MEKESLGYKKKFISANSLYLNSLKLAKKIYDSGFKPDSLIALWRGGTPIGIVIHEFFRYKGNEIKVHKAVRTESYKAMTNSGKVKVEEFSDMLININEDSNLLIIDDIFDSGKTIKGIVDKIKSESKNPKIKIATVYYKPKNNKTDIVPDFYLKKTGSWLVFPHELEDLTEDEIKKKSKKEHKVLFR